MRREEEEGEGRLSRKRASFERRSLRISVMRAWRGERSARAVRLRSGSGTREGSSRTSVA